MLELVSIGVITKERTPLYGNLGFYKNLNKAKFIEYIVYNHHHLWQIKNKQKYI